MKGHQFSPCGLSCILCRESYNGCIECENMEGEANCYQLACCTNRNLDGCWQCNDFPCNNGHYASAERRGIMIALAVCIKNNGSREAFEIISRELGSAIDYSEFSNISEHNILNLLNRTNR